MLTLEMIRNAREALGTVATMTPVIHSKFINPEADVYIKCENMQVTGSFKLRGAYNKMVHMTADEKSQGVVACSAGNHAQGVALAAQRENIPAIICMPAGAPLAKIEATRSYGAEVVLVSGVYDDAAIKATQLQKEKGYTFLHPFNDPYVIAGQGTIGLEVLEQVEDAEVVFIPIGGGGLASGVAYAIKSENPNCKVYGVQAEGAPSMFESLAKGRVSVLKEIETIADGIAVKQPGDFTFSLCQEYLDGVVTVSEDEIASAILLLIEKHKMVAEGAGAVSVAAAMYQKADIKGKKTVCILSGGNVDITILHRIIDRGLQVNGRLTKITVTMIDKPGQFNRLIYLISAAESNIVSINHDRMVKDIAVGKCLVNITLESKNEEHSQALIKTLQEEGFQVNE